MKGTILGIFPIFSFITLFLSKLTPGQALPTNKTDVKICQTEACKTTAQIFKDSMDTTIDPCDNFYQHVCENWGKQQHKSALNNYQLIVYSNDQEILDFLQKNNTEEEPEIVHKIRKIYSQCLNQDKKGVLNSMNALLQQIVGIPVEILSLNETESFDYIAGLAKFSRKTGLKPFFDLDVSENPYDRATNFLKLRPTSLTWNSYFSMDSYKDIIGKNVPERSLANHDQQIPKQCENFESLYCQYWRSNYTSVPEFLVEETKQITERCLLVSIFLSLPFISSVPTNARLSYFDTKKATVTANLLTYDNFSLKIRQHFSSKNPFTNYTSSYVPRTLQDLQHMTDKVAKEVNTKLPVFNWTRYIEELFVDIQNVTLDLKDPGKIKIITTGWDYVQDMLQEMHTVKSPEHIKYIIWYSVLSTYYHNYIAKLFNDSYMMKTSCSYKIASSFGMALTYMYSSKPKYKKIKIDIRKMFGYIKQSTKERIQHSSWLDEKTKEKALKKLDLMKSNIVYPNFTKSSASGLHNFYGHIKLGENFFDTMLSKDEAEFERRLGTLNQLNDLAKDSGKTTANAVNAFYNDYDNSLNIPAAIVQDPFYNADSLAALNFGGIGSLVGHELSHGFDNKGRQFNEFGNIEDWWQEETLEKYKTKGKCFVEAYATYNITLKSFDPFIDTLVNITLKGNSKLTLSEDIADNEGFKSALFAYKKYIAGNGQEPLLPQFENYTHDQLFTLSFAYAGCESPSGSNAASTDPHSPQGVRINGVLKNSNEFAEIWECPKGSNMNPNADKCSIW